MAGEGATDLRVAHTAHLGPRLLEAARSLLVDAFADHEDGPVDAWDWEHALGGTHALVTRGSGADLRVLAHGSLVQRRTLHWDRHGAGGRALRCGYVEAVAVQAEVRGLGLGRRIMTALEELLPAYDLGALGTTAQADGFYAARGWSPWRGRTYAASPHGLVRTAGDDDAVRVLPVPGGPPLDLEGDLACDWRDGDVW